MNTQATHTPDFICNGNFVETLFDTGAMGCTVLYGKVVKSGPKRFTVEWESGLRNSLRRDDHRVTKARNQETARAAIARAQGGAL